MGERGKKSAKPCKTIEEPRRPATPSQKMPIEAHLTKIAAYGLGLARCSPGFLSLLNRSGSLERLTKLQNAGRRYTCTRCSPFQGTTTREEEDYPTPLNPRSFYSYFIRLDIIKLSPLNSSYPNRLHKAFRCFLSLAVDRACPRTLQAGCIGARISSIWASYLFSSLSLSLSLCTSLQALWYRARAFVETPRFTCARSAPV